MFCGRLSALLLDILNLKEKIVLLLLSLLKGLVQILPCGLNLTCQARFNIAIRGKRKQCKTENDGKKTPQLSSSREIFIGKGTNSAEPRPEATSRALDIDFVKVASNVHPRPIGCP